MANNNDPQIWYFSQKSDQNDKDIQAVQAQAGKVFVHQQGPLLKFPPESDSIDNSCLCKYRYMRYFSFYQYVNSRKSAYTFFKNFQASDSGFLDYETENEQGYGWQLISGPNYLGCYPTGSFTLGQWIDVNLPYGDSDSHSNVTFPSPSYAPITTEQNKASLKCMIVSSYKCCNGTKGCGIKVNRHSDSILTFDFPICVQDFYVTGLQQDGSNSISTIPIEGTQQCCVRSYTRKQYLIDCNKAFVRAYSPINADQSDCPQECPECFQSLPDYAIGVARTLKRNNKCVNWKLWRWSFSSCQKCDTQKVQADPVFRYQEVPVQVIGLGGGWSPIKNHDPDKKFVYCSPGSATIYQWNYSQQKGVDPQPPPNLTQNPCKDNCSSYGGDQPGTGNISDSLSGFSNSSIPSSQKPCNTPDAYPRLYKQFYFQEFNVWQLKVTQVDPDDPDNPPDSSIQDPCYPTYKVSPQSIQEGPDGKKLTWTRRQSNKKDYQLIRYFKGTSFQAFKDKGSFYMVLPTWQTPPETIQDSRLSPFNFTLGEDGEIYLQDPDKNNCQYLYQVYLTGCKCQDDECKEQQEHEQGEQQEQEEECESKVPIITSGVCTKWNRIGPVHQSVLKKRGISPGNWQISTTQNTFSYMYPRGQLVYSVLSKEPDYCGDLPQAPQKRLWYGIAQVTFDCDQQRDPKWQQHIQWTFDSVSHQYCTEPDDSGIVQGWKTAADPQAEPLQNQTDIYPEQCVIYYIKKLQDVPQVVDQDGQEYEPDPQDQGRPGGNVHWEACLQDGDRLAYLGSQGCIQQVHYEQYQGETYEYYDTNCDNAGMSNPTEGYDGDADYTVYMQVIQASQDEPPPAASDGSKPPSLYGQGDQQPLRWLYVMGYSVRPYGLQPYYWYGQMKYSFWSDDWQCEPRQISLQLSNYWDSCTGNRTLYIIGNYDTTHQIPLAAGTTIVLLPVSVLTNEQYGLYQDLYVPVKIIITKKG